MAHPEGLTLSEDIRAEKEHKRQTQPSIDTPVYFCDPADAGPAGAVGVRAVLEVHIDRLRAMGQLLILIEVSIVAHTVSSAFGVL
mgnify:CR=1 FL=1